MNRFGRVSFVTVLWVVTVGAIGVVFLSRVMGGNGEREGTASAGGREGAPGLGALGLVDPAPYRATIERLEAALYKEAAPTLSDADLISALAGELGNDLLRGTSPGARRGGQDILTFGSMVGAEADVGYSAMNLPRARRNWELVRDRVFRRASWFGSATGGLAAAQTPPAPAAPAGTVRALEGVANDLDWLIRLGRSQVAQFGDVGVDVAPQTREALDLAQRFATWSRGWTDRINGLRRAMPPLPPNADPDLMMAWQELDRVSHELSGVGRASGSHIVPFRSEREAHFRTAEALLQSARRYLAKAAR